MRGRRQRGLGEDAFDGRVGALARRAAGAIGDGNEIRLKRRQPADRLPQRLLHLRGFGRKEFERHADAARLAGIDEAAFTRRVHQATSRVFGVASTMRGSRASQSETVILPCGPGAIGCWRTTSRPAASSHCVTVSGAKPSRRWACSSRRNSRSCGAKSTTSSRPPGRSTRTASRMARALSSRKCST